MPNRNEVLTPQGDGDGFDFVIISRLESNDAWQLHARGVVAILE